jgi:hypothetical protein
LNINKIGSRSTLAALAFGALVTVLPASADTISFTTSSSPTGVDVGTYAFNFNGAVVNNHNEGYIPTLLSGTTTTTSFGGFTLSPGSGPASQVIDVNVTPTRDFCIAILSGFRCW